MTETPPMTELPSPGTKRWVARRKAAVVAAVQGGLITLEDACHRYELSEEEFLSWQRALETHGVNGLRATCLQRYRGDASSRLGASPRFGRYLMPGYPSTLATTAADPGFRCAVGVAAAGAR